MTREVSRQNSGDQGGIRPDVVGKRDLDPNQAEDRPDPIAVVPSPELLRMVDMIDEAKRHIDQVTGIGQRILDEAGNMTEAQTEAVLTNKRKTLRPKYASDDLIATEAARRDAYLGSISPKGKN